MYIAVLLIAIAVAIILVLRALTGNSATGRSHPLSPAEADQQIEHLVISGRKIEAIKLHRRGHGSSLRQAKDAIEVEQRRLELEGRA